MKKKIVVNNRNDYNRFVKKLFIYKSILYKNVYFELENIVEDENLDYLIKGLNIKNRKKRIDFIYDMCCLIYVVLLIINVLFREKIKIKSVMVAVESVFIKQVRDALLRI